MASRPPRQATQKQANSNESSTYDKLITYLSKSHPNYSISDFNEALQTFRTEKQTLNGLSLSQLEEGILTVVRRKYPTEQAEIDSSRSEDAHSESNEDSVAATLWSTFKRYRERERSSKNSDPSEDQCLICLEALSSNKTERFACAHVFHRACLEEWFKIERTCPLCRKLLLFTDEFPSLR